MVFAFGGRGSLRPPMLNAALPIVDDSDGLHEAEDKVAAPLRDYCATNASCCCHESLFDSFPKGGKPVRPRSLLIARVAMNSPKLCGTSRREMTDVSLASNFEARYWTQALGVSRCQLDDAVRVVGTQVELVMGYLRVPKRRLVDRLRIVLARS